MPPPGNQLVAVALQQPDALERNPELLVLGKRRPMPLTVIERAGGDRDIAVGLEADAAHLVGGRSGHLKIVADATTAQQTALAAFFLTGSKPVPIGLGQCLIEHRGELTAVVRCAVRRLVRHRRLGNVIAAAQFDLVDAQLGGGVDQPLHVIIAFGPAGAAIGPDRRRVGDDDPGRHFNQRRLVDADRVLDRVGGRRAACAASDIGAEIAVTGHPQGEEVALRVERQFGGHLVIAAVAVRDEAFRTLVGPLDRPAQRPRGMEQGEVFRIDRRLHAERTADIAGQDPHLVALDTKHVGKAVFEPEHALTADAQSPAIAGLIVFGERRARLHRADDDAVARNLEPGHVGGLGKCCCDLVGVAIVELGGNIAGRRVMQLWGAGCRRFARPGDRRQRLDIEKYRFGRVLGLCRGFCDNDRHRVADIAHPVAGQRRTGRRCIGVPSLVGIACPSRIGLIPAAVRSGPV